MIVKTQEADRFAANPPKTLRAALVFGPDAGLVQERAEKLLKAWSPISPILSMWLTSVKVCCSPASGASCR